MKMYENRKNQEAGYLLPNGWCRDSARRLPLRQAGLSPGRDLSPRWATEAAHTQVGAVLSAVMRRSA